MTWMESKRKTGHRSWKKENEEHEERAWQVEIGIVHVDVVGDANKNATEEHKKD